ncbi:20107_t:CDS:2, partial [Dentiscutata erythropus]
MSENTEIQLESTSCETNIISTSLQNEPHKINIKENSNTSELRKESSNVAVMRNFYVISFGYIFFTLTDSGLRMIVFLELYDRHFSALQISIMFTLYEFFGVIINLTGGIIGSRLGIRVCLVSGLFVQIIGITMLCGFSGIAKDLVKLSGKSVAKLVTKDDSLHQTLLFKLVAWITGAKNSVKGAGFFWGPIGWSYLGTGALLAGWIIFYGTIQSSTPQLILKPLGIYPVKSGPYCHRDKVAMNVGFYYMANAFGRLIGLIVGGVLYYYVELDACLWVSVGALIFCTFVSFFLGPVPESQN